MNIVNILNKYETSKERKYGVEKIGVFNLFARGKEKEGVRNENS